MIYTKLSSAAGPIKGYIALGRTLSRRLNVYRYRQNILLPELLGNQPTDSGTAVRAVAWSSGGNYLAVATDDAAGVKFFSRSGSTFTGQTVPSNVDTDHGDVSISSDGNYVAVAASANGSDTGRIYHNSSGTLTNLTSVGSFTFNTRSCALSSDGTYAAFLGTSSPTFLRIKIRSGSGSAATYSDMTLASQPSSGTDSGFGDLSGLAFSPDDAYLAVCPTNPPDQTIYKFNGGTSTYEKLASPFSGSLPDRDVEGCSFNAQGDLLAISTDINTFFYERAGDTFTYVATISGGYRGGFHPGGNFYITGSGQIYKKNTASSWTAVGSVLQSNGRCAAFSPYV